MKKYSFFVITFFITTLYGNNIQELYKKASIYEKNGEFKKAMQIYKQLAKKNLKDENSNTEKTSLEETLVKKELLQKEEKFKALRGNFFKRNIDKIKDKETENTIEQLIVKDFGLYTYKTNYLLPVTYDTKNKDGRNQYETKFQLSFEKPLTYNIFGLDETLSFAYTQKSYWQTSKESAPFRESNYQPEVFLTFPYKKENSSLKAYKISLLHESNGQDGEKSRSWNRLYLESFFQFSNLFVIPRVWYRIPEQERNDDNKDIQKYLGYGDLTLFFPYKKHTFELKLRNNLRLSEDNKGAVEFNWTFPLPSFLNLPNSFGYFQVFSGYADSLIDYDEDINKIGIGIAFSR